VIKKCRIQWIRRIKNKDI